MLSKEGSKRKTADFRLKVQFSKRKSVTKFLCLNTISDNVVRHSVAYVTVQKWLVGTSLLCENLAESDQPL